jgi:hypothetical protein
MQRTAALLVVAIAASVGCRSSSQPVNPFIRTTVPPPGTGEAAVVVPGDPYYPGSTPTPSPQLVTPTTPPPAAAAVPVTPAPVVPATPAQPPTRDLKKSVPGGNLFYHQSSTPPQLRRDAHGIAAGDRAINAADPDAVPLGGESDAVSDALALSKEPDAIVAANFEDYGGRLPGESPVQPSTREPSARPSTPTQLHYSSQQKVRVVGTPDDDTDEYQVEGDAMDYNSSSSSSSLAQSHAQCPLA